MRTGRVRPSNKYLQAFKDELNWIGTGLIASACLFTGLPLVLPFAWAAYETAYLLFVPDTRWYEKRLSRKADAEVERRRRALKEAYLPTLLEHDRRRFEQLEQLRAEIGAQHTASQEWLLEILRKLDFLLERFLLFGSKHAQYLGYLRDLAVREGTIRAPRTGGLLGAWRGDAPLTAEDLEPLLVRVLGAYDRRLAEAQHNLARETDPPTRAVLQKNLDVLTRLRANAEQIGQTTRNLERQLDLVVDTFALINGQLRTSPPEQMLSDVDDVIGSSQTLTDTLAEVAPLEEAIQRLDASSERE
jgi:hypothetical protein